LQKIKKNQSTYGFGNINHWYLIFALGGFSSGFFRDEGPQFVGVDGWAVFPVSLHMEDSHTDLTIEPWMAIDE